VTDARLAEEQAAVQRVVSLVVRGVAAQELFDAVATEAAALIADDATLVRRHEDGTFVVVASCGGPAAVGARIDVPGGAAVNVPILVEDRVWGIVGATAPNRRPDGAEERLALFWQIAAAAIASAETRAKFEDLVDEQTALREVAELVARGAAPQEVFAAVAMAASGLLNDQAMTLTRFDGDRELVVAAAHGAPAPVGMRIAFEPDTLPDWVRRFGEAVRVDDYTRERDAELAASFGLFAAVAAPIAVEGEVWGMLTATSASRALPAGTEHRLQQFAKLVSAALANSQARAELQALADEQSALRRVATLVAREASQADVFTAIAEEIGQLLGSEGIRMLRYEDDREAVVVANSGTFKDGAPVGAGQPLGGENVRTRVFRTGAPARIDRRPVTRGIRSVVAAPIVVEGRLWGAMTTATTQDEPLPPETEARLGQFTELMASAIGNTESHARADRLTQEQAALRRVATLVAAGVPSEELFDAVAGEVGKLVGADLAGIARYEGDDALTILPAWAATGEPVDVAGRVSLEGATLPKLIFATGRPAREDHWDDIRGPVAELTRDRLGIRSVVGSPILVGGRVWGGLFVSSRQLAHLPGDTESRLGNFTELVATAIANADARAQVERLLQEQAALRRVATVVADGASPTAVFDVVAAELEALLDSGQAALSRFESGAEVTVVAHRGPDTRRLPPGSRVSHGDESVTGVVRRTGRAARMDYAKAGHGALVDAVRDMGLRVTVGAPIVVGGRLWGVITASWTREAPPPDTEERMTQFAQLLDAAIANADSRAQLTASRARLLTAADEARRRVVRDLHDGAQQRLVHTVLTLKLALRALRQNDGAAEPLVGEALAQAEQGNEELRELAHGILPSALTHGGLQAGVDAVVERLDLPVQVDIPAERFPLEIEASSYFIVAEALTNIVKHARATRAEIKLSTQDGTLSVEVRDDGIGGADPRGHGLVGMGDRVTALGGRLEIQSPVGRGTLVAATLPLSPG
jgi:signal transduction histidine kinase